MRVLYVITLSERGGSQAHVRDLIQGLHRKISVELCTSSPGFLTEEAAALGVRCHIVPELVRAMRVSDDSRAFLRLRRLFRDLNPDLIHAHTAKAGFVTRAVAATTGHPVVFTPHGWSFSERSSGLQRLIALPLERVAARWNDQIIAVSKAEYSLGLSNRVGHAGSLSLIHNGIGDVLSYATEKSEIITLVMLARFAPPKDHETVVRAMVGIRHPFLLKFVGDGADRLRIQRLVRSLGLESKVEFTGTRSDVPEILSHAHAFVLSSRSESFPISILEAMRAGLPVVATDVGGVAEAVIDCETGILVPPGDVDSMRTALQTMVVDELLRSRLGKNGRIRFENNFTAARMVDRTMTLYQDILNRRQRAEAWTPATSGERRDA